MSIYSSAQAQSNSSSRARSGPITSGDPGDGARWPAPAVFAGAGGAALGQDIGTAAAGAACGAMTAEIVAETLAGPFKQDVVEEVRKQQDTLGRPLSEGEIQNVLNSKLHDITQIAKISGVISGLLTGDSRGVGAAGSAAGNAIENNFLQVAAPYLLSIGAAAVEEAALYMGFAGSVIYGGHALHEATKPAEDAGDGAAGAAGEEAVEGGGAKVPVGRRGEPIEVTRGTNAPATIGGRKYTGHSLDSMQGRGVPPSAVEECIKTGVKAPGRTPGTTTHTIPGLKTITNAHGDVVTVIPK